MSVAAAPVGEMGYVLSSARWAGWIPDLDVVNELPELRYPQNLRSFGQMQLDPQVSSTVSAVQLPLRSTGWWLDPNGADAEVVEFVVQNLGLGVRGVDKVLPVRTKDRFSFAEHLDLALEALPLGHAVFEQVARVEADGRAHLRKLALRPQASISEWKVDSDGGLVHVRQLEAKNPMPVDRLVVYSHQRRGAAWHGRSILRTAWKFWILKDRMLRVQAISGDRTGVGTPVYTAAEAPLGMLDDDAKVYAEAQRREGLKIAKSYRGGENTGLSLPHGASFNVVGVQGNLPDLDKFIRYYDEQIGKSALANFLSLGGENSRGSYALGTTFADFFVQSLQATAKWIEDTFSAHVIEDLVDWNFGAGVRAPRLVCDEIGSKHPITADAVSLLINSGALQADDNLEMFLRSTYGITQRDTEWGKGDLDNMSKRAQMFKMMRDAGASFETAKAAAGLSGLEPEEVDG